LQPKFNLYLAGLIYMIRALFIFIIFLTGSLQIALAQTSTPAPIAPNFPGFTFKWSGGYAWQPTNNENIPAPVINTLNPSVDALTGFGTLYNISAAGAVPQPEHHTYGQGFNIGLRFGYMFNPYIGVDLGISYAQSTTIAAYQQTIFYQPDSSSNPAPTGGYLDNSITTKSMSMVLTPAINFAYSKPKFKVYPYGRVGLALPVFTRINHTMNMTLEGVGASNTTYSAPYFIGDQTTIIMQTNMLFTVGVTGALGIVWRPVNFVNFFAEINGQYLNMKAKTTTISEWAADGYDMTPYEGAYRLQTNYVKSLNARSNNYYYNTNADANSPKQDVSPVFPFSNIGFNIGVQLVLSKKVFKDEDGFDQDRTKKVKKVKVKKLKAPDTKPAGS